MFQALETIHWKSEDWAFVEQHKLLREIEPAGSANCSDCSSRHEVEYISAADGQMRGYIHCDECGREEVGSDRLKRWEIASEALLQAIFCELNLSLDVKSKDCLWHVGRATWAGSSRRIWFVRSFPGHHGDAVDILRKNPKAVVFAPTMTRSDQWREATGSLVIQLECVTEIKAGNVNLKIDEIEGLIDQSDLRSTGRKIGPIRKRAVKTRKIEMLTKELIKFLRGARDHAFSTLDANGAAEQLPRPTKKKLGELAGLEPYDVTRCFDDALARELRLYWDMAVDLEQVMKFQGPISEGANS